MRRRKLARLCRSLQEADEERDGATDLRDVFSSEPGFLDEARTANRAVREDDAARPHFSGEESPWLIGMADVAYMFSDFCLIGCNH